MGCIYVDPESNFARLEGKHSHLLGHLSGPALPLWNMDQQILQNLHNLVHGTLISQNYILLQLLKTCFVHSYLIEGSHITGLVCIVCGYMHMRLNLNAHARLQEPEASVRCFSLSLFTLIFETDRSLNLELAIWTRLASLGAPGTHMSLPPQCCGFRCDRMPFTQVLLLVQQALTP